MNKTESAQYIEAVRGIIIADEPTSHRARLFNEDRPQSGYFEGNSDAEVRALAIAYVEAMKCAWVWNTSDFIQTEWSFAYGAERHSASGVLCV